MSVIIECNHVSKAFGGLKAVDDVSFSVEEGEILGLIGPNGAGKTTLFNVMAGFYKPTSGEVKFNNEVISGLASPRICKKGIARTFQQPQPFEGLTVLQNVMVGHFFGRPRNRNLSIEEIIDFVGLTTQKDRLVDDLPILCQKQLEIAKTLATNPTLLLVDEIASGLTAAEQDEIVSLIQNIHDELNITVLAIEHIMRTIMRVADRIIVLVNGQILKVGEPKSVSKDAEVIKAYLGEEYTIESARS